VKLSKNIPQCAFLTELHLDVHDLHQRSWRIGLASGGILLLFVVVDSHLAVGVHKFNAIRIRVLHVGSDGYKEVLALIQIRGSIEANFYM